MKEHEPNPVFLKSLCVRGLLSFGPEGFDLPLESLNVFIGPNGSGKSNLLEILALLKASPSDLSRPLKEMGGVKEWFWKGETSTGEAVIEAVSVGSDGGSRDIRHRIAVSANGTQFEVSDEQIESASETDPISFYDLRRGAPVLREFENSEEETIDGRSIRLKESILSQVNLPSRYPVLSHLQDSYKSIFLFRNWQFGPNAAIRKETEPNADNTFLRDGGTNLDVVLSTFRGDPKRSLIKHLQQIYEGIEDFGVAVGTSGTMLYIEEKGGRSIPKTRLSDGTLRYLCLLAVLLHPSPPPLIVIEEPEQGLHPDAVLEVARLLIEASKRTQIIVTTHSTMLVDAMSNEPEAIVVCERTAGSTTFRRLNSKDLSPWLEKFSLADLWTSGELGGNRW